MSEIAIVAVAEEEEEGDAIATDGGNINVNTNNNNNRESDADNNDGSLPSSCSSSSPSVSMATTNGTIVDSMCQSSIVKDAFGVPKSTISNIETAYDFSLISPEDQETIEDDDIDENNTAGNNAANNIIWSDDIEQAYFQQVLKDARQQRIDQGKTISVVSPDGSSLLDADEIGRAHV